MTKQTYFYTTKKQMQFTLPFVLSPLFAGSLVLLKSSALLEVEERFPFLSPTAGGIGGI